MYSDSCYETPVKYNFMMPLRNGVRLAEDRRKPCIYLPVRGPIPEISRLLQETCQAHPKAGFPI
jgi:hypothetical protein